MKLKKARIYRFKTIQEDTFNLSDLTALVGENNSGKSNILDALDVFFSPEKYENEFEKYIKGHRRGSFIIDCFFARNSSWPSNFRKNLDADDLLRIRFQYNSTEQSYNHYEFKNGNLSQPVVLDNSKKEWLFNHIAFLKITAIRDIDKEINSSDSSLISLVKHLYEKKYSDRDILKNQLENVGKYAERKILSNLVEIWVLPRKVWVEQKNI